MSATTAEKSAKNTDKPTGKPGGKRSKRKLLLLLLLPLLLLGGGGTAAFLFVPAVQEAMRKIMPGGGEAQAEAAPGAPAGHGAFVEFPEMTITLPNGGRPRQLRLKLAAEIAGDPALVQPDLLSPRVYDSLVLYLRTLRDSELEGALAMDRLRGDLHRRLELLLGPGKLRDVLVTSFVVA
jgi:flagellar FliL protein